MKDGCAVALKGKEAKQKEITNEKFKEKDELAIADIYLALDEVVLFNVFEGTMAKCLWDKLQTINEGKSTSNRIFLQKQLYNLKIEDEASLQEHLNDFNTLIIKLAAIEVKIDEKEKDTLVMNISKDTHLTYEFV